MNTVTRGIPIPPGSVGGTGTTAKTFAPVLYIPGTSRVNGRKFKVVGSGSITTGINATAALGLLVTFPASKYPVANITAAVLVNNVATYTAGNNYKAGQFITVASCTTATFNFTTGKKITAANATAFSVAITNANISSENEVGTGAVATIAPTPILAGTGVAINAGSGPFSLEAEFSMDDVSGRMQADKVQDAINGTVADAAAAGANVVVGVASTDEPVATVTATITFNASDANNAATLNKFDLEM